jgi:aspartate/methionine/tyrosine aminotransferase
MDDAKLQKVILGPDWIDLSYGEPKVVMSAMIRQLGRDGSNFSMPNISDLSKWEYQPAAGNPKLVEFLENKYNAKVLVCNGAKQALAAVFYAYRQSGYDYIDYSVPYYPANPSIAKMSGLTVVNNETDDFCSASNVFKFITSPNNPDGINLTNEAIKKLNTKFNIIHDAVYYTPTYLPDGQVPEALGNVQIFSMSKMYGVSGLRIGYAVFHDETMYKTAVDFIEKTTAGVSIASQTIALEIERYFKEFPLCLAAFEQEARSSIALARKELENLDPEVLIPLPSQSNSMFAWCVKGPKLNYKSAKVYMVEGSVFGQSGLIRMNIAHPVEAIREAVSRLNKYKE